MDVKQFIQYFPTSQVLSLAAAASFTFLIWEVYNRINTKNPPNLPPLVKGGLPLVGHLLQLKKDPMQFLRDAKEAYGPCFRLDVLGQGRLVVVTDDLISEVMKNKNFNFTQGIEAVVPLSTVVKISYDHKFVGEALSPREKHPVVYPVKNNFKEDQLEVFTERIQYGLNTALDEHLKIEKGQEKSVDISKVMLMAIAYISCPCFAGSKVGNDRRLIIAMANFTQKILKAAIFLSLFPDRLGRFFVRRFFSVEPEMDIIMNSLVPELQRIRDTNADDEEEVSFAGLALNLPKEDGSLRSVQDSAYLFSNVALASVHSTSHFSSFAFHELACRPSLLQDLRNEISTLGNHRTPETVGKLPLMESFLRELLRFNSDYLSMHHLALQDTVLSTGHVIPKGSLVVGTVRQVHCDPRFAPIDKLTGEAIVGDTPLEEFDAYRYLHKDIKATSIGLGYVAFGLGAHACPGRHFAANEIKYVIAEMIMRYNIRTKDGKRAPDTVVLGMATFPPREPLIFEAL